MTARLARVFLLAILSISIVGCSSRPDNNDQPTQPQTTAKAKKPEANELKAGREALQVMYASARVWAGDAQPASLSSNPRKGDVGGKAAVWSATFVSVSKKSIRNFMWSGAAGDDAPEAGVSLGSIDRYSPENASTQPFDMSFLKIDSTEAFDTAQKHGGATILKKAPDTLMQYQLLWEAHLPRLSWSIKYAPSGSGAKLDAIVNASTGQFIHIAK